LALRIMACLVANPPRPLGGQDSFYAIKMTRN